MTGERYGINVPKIGPCMGSCGQPGRGRIKPCYPTGAGPWLCHECVQARQAETASDLVAADAAGHAAALATDGGEPDGE